MRNVNDLKLLCWIMCLVVMFVSNVCAELDDIINNISQNEPHPAKEFNNHVVVKPIMYHGRQKRDIATTRDETGFNHVDHLTIIIPINREELVLDLILNKQLIPKGFFRKIQVQGMHQLVQPSPEEVDLCYYNGKVRNKPNSWVALSTCYGLSGTIFDGEEIHYIEKTGFEDDNEHTLYKHSDLIEQNKTCGHKDNRKGHNSNNINQIRKKRAVPAIRGPYNANNESKYIELVLVIDNRKFKELNESISKTEDYSKSVANVVNAIYAPLNIFVALVGVVIWTESDEIRFSTNGDTTLSQFLHYRKEHLVMSHPNDNAQLITKFPLDNGVVAKALKGPICTYEYSGAINVDHSKVIGVIATTVAHSIGHNFGMNHDTSDCTCPDDRCIMNSNFSERQLTHWSSCSLESLLFAFVQGMDYCLRNKPIALLNGSVCGNGFVEVGEECDCGLPEYCNNSCCDATTCRLQRNASCATGECCDLTTCKFKIAAIVCRSAHSECDLPEYCTGVSEYCPENVYKMDTEICENGKAFCYQGVCRTQEDQCRLLWGRTGKPANDQCYTLNLKGNRHGNCGYNKNNHNYIKCNDEDKFCGQLACQHLGERLEFGLESVSILSHSFLNRNGSIVPCRTAIIDLGLDQVDPGLVPSGAKCGDGKMCLNQKCVSVSSLRENRTCPHNCYNNGWCNNLGHCHCKDGYVQPLCEHLWPGGSVDSGPTSYFPIKQETDNLTLASP